LDAAPIWDDLSTFDGNQWRGVVDLVSAGYPCQPFSVAGQRRGADDPRHLWPHVARIIREVGPRVVVLENVAGHVVLGLPDVLGELAEMGFDAEWGCYRASEVGAPHQRERVFVLAYRSGQQPGQLPRCESDGRVGTAGVRETLADRPGRGLGELRWAQGDAGLADGGEQAVADASVVPELQPEDEGCAERGSRAARSGVGSRGSVMGHTEGTRPGCARPCGSRQEVTWSFPPGPSDRVAWAAVLAAAPELAPAVEPAVCGVADGVPEKLVSAVRRHRLRCLGNAVVPAQAEHAVRCLLRRVQ